MFEKCFLGIKLDSNTVGVIAACLQALSVDESEAYSRVIEDLMDGESSGFELACIYLDNDYEEKDQCPEFEGVCFNYLEEFAVVNRKTANKILLRSLDIVQFDDSKCDIIRKIKNKGGPLS